MFISLSVIFIMYCFFLSIFILPFTPNFRCSNFSCYFSLDSLFAFLYHSFILSLSVHFSHVFPDSSLTSLQFISVSPLVTFSPLVISLSQLSLFFLSSSTVYLPHQYPSILSHISSSLINVPAIYFYSFSFIHFLFRLYVLVEVSLESPVLDGD